MLKFCGFVLISVSAYLEEMSSVLLVLTSESVHVGPKKSAHARSKNHKGQIAQAKSIFDELRRSCYPCWRHRDYIICFDLHFFIPICFLHFSPIPASCSPYPPPFCSLVHADFCLPFSALASISLSLACSQMPFTLAASEVSSTACALAALILQDGAAPLTYVSIPVIVPVQEQLSLPFLFLYSLDTQTHSTHALFTFTLLFFFVSAPAALRTSPL